MHERTNVRAAQPLKVSNKMKYFWACTICGNKHHIDA